MRKEGRCFTATPNAEMIKHGIKEVTILLWMRARIFLHHEAFFIAERQKAFIDIPWQRRIYIDLDQEIRNENGEEPELPRRSQRIKKKINVEK